MSDLDQLLDTLVADVRSQTRAPGASTAIERAQRRRKVVAVAGGLAAVAVIAAGSVLAVGTLGGGERRSSLVGTPTASPLSPAEQQAAGTERYQALRTALTSVPGWAITAGAERDFTVMDRCRGGEFDALRGGLGSGNNPGPYIPHGGLPVRVEEIGFGYPADAPVVMDRIIAQLASCTEQSWDIQPIGQTGAVLAVTDATVVWIQQKGGHIDMLHVPTTDGPPPLAVQVEVAELIYSWMN